MPKRKNDGLKLTDLQSQYLDGLMLGDGHIKRPKPTCNGRLEVNRKLTDIEYLKDNIRIFEEFVDSEIKVNNKFDIRTQKTYSNCSFYTRYCSEFYDERDRWYETGKKEVPKDIKLTPLTCAIWFCDDGYIGINKHKTLELCLATYAFSKNSKDLLISILNRQLNERFTIISGVIKGNHMAAVAFVNYIEDFIPNSMKRKIVWGEENLNKKTLPWSKYRLPHHLHLLPQKQKDTIKSISKIDKKAIEIAEEIHWLKVDKKYSTVSAHPQLYQFLNSLLDKKEIERYGSRRQYTYKLNVLGIEKYSEILI